MNLKKISATLIWSENYQALASWYKEKLGATVIEELTLSNDTGTGLSMGESYLWIGKHSEVKGKNKDPFRIMFNISVDSVEETYKELVSKGVNFIAKPFLAPTGKYFATFEDLDGNILQFIGAK